MYWAVSIMGRHGEAGQGLNRMASHVQTLPQEALWI